MRRSIKGIYKDGILQTTNTQSSGMTTASSFDSILRTVKAPLLLLLSVGLLGLPGCTSDSAGKDNTNPAEAGGFQAHQPNTYYHLKGFLGEMPISMELMEETDYHNGYGHFFRGFYRYDRYGGPISVYGNLDSDKTLTLTEQGGWDSTPHIFQGRWDEKGKFSGKWINGNGKDEYPFDLRPNEDVVPLEGWGVEDSLAAFPHWEHSPALTYEAEWLQVKEGWGQPALTSFIEQRIAIGMLGEGYKEGEALPIGLEAQCQDYYEEYKAEMRSLYEAGMIDSLAEPDAFLSTSYNYNSSVQVYFNSPQLLTLGFTDYAYTGGAHGLFGTDVESYDLRNLRMLKLSDVLLPGYEDAVSKALDRAVRIKYNLQAAQALDAILFEKEIQPNENFGVTDKGIFFVYGPYEIAPYAAGEIELFVSFEQISEFVQAAWLPAELTEE